MLKQRSNSNSPKPEKSDKKNIKQIKQLLGSAKSLPRLVSSTGEEVVLSEHVYNTLYKVLEGMESGTEICISPVNGEITIAEAADILNVSVSYLKKLLEQGEISGTFAGNTMHLNRLDVFSYKNDRDEKRREGLSELTSFMQEEGFYD